MSASPLLTYKQVHRYYLSRFHICVLIYDIYILFSFWLTWLSITGSRFIHLIRTDSNGFFLRLNNILLHICPEGDGGTNWDSSMDSYTSPYIKQWEPAVWCRELKSSALWQSREAGCGRRWEEVRGRFKRERTCRYLWLIHIDVWQLPTQYCKAIILQLKIKKMKSYSHYVNFTHLM